MEVPQFIWWIVGAGLVLCMLFGLALAAFFYLLLKATAEAYKERQAGVGLADHKGKTIKLTPPPKTGT